MSELTILISAAVLFGVVVIGLLVYSCKTSACPDDWA